VKAKFSRIKTTLRFRGEDMTCRVCGKHYKSDPHVESQWTFVELQPNFGYYICPRCFGNDPQWWETHSG
jgi:hypothetical protein